MKNKKHDMIIALKEAIKILEETDLKITDSVLVCVTQYKSKEERYVTDFHVAA